MMVGKKKAYFRYYSVRRNKQYNILVPNFILDNVSHAEHIPPFMEFVYFLEKLEIVDLDRIQMWPFNLPEASERCQQKLMT